jgi:hypothetical protein
MKGSVPKSARRLNITLDAVYAVKLARMAERRHVNEGALAQVLVSQALDKADLDPQQMADLLDSLVGARERANTGVEDAQAGQTSSLDDL